MTWHLTAIRWRKAGHWMFASLKTVLLLSRLFWKNVSHPLCTFNRLTHTLSTMYYQTMNLAFNCIHSQRTNKTKKKIQCFISGFLHHILTVLLIRYCFRHCQQVFAFLLKAIRLYACVHCVCLPLLRGSELPLFPWSLYPEKQRPRSTTQWEHAHTLKHMLM